MSRSVSRFARFALPCVAFSTLALPFSSVAEAAEALSGKVTHVTLYRGQAMVTRTLKVEGTAGMRELTVSNLPANVIPDSLFAEAGEGLEVRAVRFQSRAVGEEPREEVREIDAKIEEASEGVQSVQKHLEILTKKSTFLDQLESFTAPTATVELSKGVLDAEALERLTEFSFAQREGILEKQAELGREQKELQRELELLKRRRGELTNGSSKTVREALIFLEKANDSDIALRLNYLTNGCGWHPSYVFRGDEDGTEVRVEYNALVRQMTGEDWSDVELTLSTAFPALSAVGPGLAPFHVSLSNNETQAKHLSQQEVQAQVRSIVQRQSAAVMLSNNALTFDDNTGQSWEVNRAANDYQCLELVGGKDVLTTLRVGDENEGPSFDYLLDGAVSLASRADQQMVRILDNTFDTKFYHVATPVLTNYVYREAELTNDSSVDLLSGPVMVYLDNRFVGRAEVDTVARGQSFVIGFGVDPQLRARRELVKKDEQFQGGNRELVADYSLVVENFKADAVAVRVFDRLPHATNGHDLRITLRSEDVALSDDEVYRRRERAKGILRWDVEIPGGATGKDAETIDYGYSAEFDRQLHLTAAHSSPNMQQEFEMLQKARRRNR